MTRVIVGMAVVLLCTCLGAISSARGADVTLASGGKSEYRIVTAADAPASVKLAARELRHYVRAATGADLEIATPGDAAAGAGKVISLGDTPAARGAGVSSDGVGLEGFRIAVRGGSLFIIGPDTPDGALTPTGGTSTGTLNGVYAFLEDHVGVRWVLPGPGGDDVPQLTALAVPTDLDRTDAPAFASRRLPYSQERREEVKEWQRRMRLGGALRINHAHNWKETVPESLFAEHPEWFPEVNGVRVPPIGRYKLETTNPGLVAHFARKAVEAFRANPDLYSFSLSPSDSAGWSQSAQSKALYETDPNGKLSVSRLILTFYNDVARLVRKEAPDRMLGGYVYAQYLYPPKGDIGGPLEPNLFLVCAPSIDYGYTLYRPNVQKGFEEIMGGWSRLTKQLGYYDLPTNLSRSGGIPTANAAEILAFIFPRLKQYDVKHVYIYGSSVWGSNGLGNYLKAKLMWDPQADVGALTRAYLDRAYGPSAGPAMAELHEVLDEATKRHYQADDKASYSLTPEILAGVYPEIYPKLESLFLRAKAAATEPAHAARLAMFEQNMILLNANLRRSELLPDAEKSTFYRTDEQVEQLLQDKGASLATGQSSSDGAPAAEALTDVRLVHPVPPAPAGAGEPTPHQFRGPTRVLLQADQDEEVHVGIDVRKTSEVVRYAVADALGQKVTSGVVQPGAVIKFAASQGQTYVLSVSTGSAIYSLNVAGSRYAVCGAGRERKSLRLLGQTTPLYMYVPEGTPAKGVTITLSSGSPGETAATDVVSPTGETVATLDTSAQPAVQFVLPPAAGSDTVAGGFWTLRFKQPASGSVDDVYLDVTGPVAPWFGVDPDQLLAVRAAQ